MPKKICPDLEIDKDPYDEGTPTKKTSHDPYGVGEKAQIREGVRAGWRFCKTIDEFAKLSNIHNVQAQAMDLFYSVSGMPDVPSFILSKASSCYNIIHSLLQHPKYHGVSWIDTKSATEDERDMLVILYVDFMRVHAPDQGPDLEGIPHYYRILRQITPRVDDYSVTAQFWKTTANAFHQESSGQRSVAGPILSQIRYLYEEYRSAKHIAPYTSIVGPSGIGKSFVIQQMARDGSYVVYASLASRGSHAYPRRSIIADQIADFVDREKMTVFFECYIAANLVNVELCREFGISPLGFFDVQVKIDFVNFQAQLCGILRELYEGANSNLPSQEHPRYRSGDKGNKEADDQDQDEFYQGHVTKVLPEYREKAKNAFSNIFDTFCANPDYAKPYLSAEARLPLQEDDPSALICFDEARQLFARDARILETEQNMRFLALRRALRHQTETGKHRDSKRFFGILLDTTAKISDFSPPHDRDSSLKFIDPSKLDLLDPIFEIDTMDLFAPDVQQGWQMLKVAASASGSNTKCPELIYLYRLGRPLWGALLRRQNPSEVLSIATAKIFGHEASQVEPIGPVEALALLSYRVNFYVALPSLAETLTAGHLRYIVDIGQGRNFLQTLQPSEPILSYCSATEMTTNPKTRLEVIKVLYNNATKGTIHLGDLGEIVAALLLLFSYDKALGEKPPSPVKISKFLDTLFSGNNEFLTGVNDRMKDQRDMEFLWQNGVVFFNHFVRLTKPPTEATLRKAFYRGAAIFPLVGFGGCDMIIPIFLPKTETMSYFLLQIKNRGHDAMTGVLRNEAKDSLQTAANLLPSTAAHISLMMSLRARKEEEKVEVVYPAPRSKTSSRANKKKDSGKMGKNFAFYDTARVVIAAVGMSLDLYRGFLHPRENMLHQETSGESLKILKRLLACTSETHTDRTGDYHNHLAPLD